MPLLRSHVLLVNVNVNVNVLIVLLVCCCLNLHSVLRIPIYRTKELLPRRHIDRTLFPPINQINKLFFAFGVESYCLFRSHIGSKLIF